ncbi:MAG: BrnT family toxin [Chloroflexota bacterium]
MRIYELIIEPGREEHIAHHGVTIEEVEEVVFGTPLILRARQGRYHVIGQMNAGRYLAIFLAPREGGVYGLVTARDADQSERRLYRSHKKL